MRNHCNSPQPGLRKGLYMDGNKTSEPTKKLDACSRRTGSPFLAHDIFGILQGLNPLEFGENLFLLLRPLPKSQQCKSPWKMGKSRELAWGWLYLGVGDLQGSGGDGLGEDLALRRHHRHGLVQGSTCGREGSWGCRNPPSWPLLCSPLALPGTAGDPLPAPMARLPGGSAAAGTTMPGGGLDAAGSAAGELCSISCEKREDRSCTCSKGFGFSSLTFLQAKVQKGAFLLTQLERKKKDRKIRNGTLQSSCLMSNQPHPFCAATISSKKKSAH